MIKILSRFTKEEEGQVIIIIAVAFTVLLGFVALAVDTGILYLEHTRLARAADAAALAGAQELPDAYAAENVAREYAQLNGIDPNNLDINFAENNRKITITVNKTVDFYFARALGFESKNIDGRAVARLSPVREMNGLIPLGINETYLPLTPGNQYLIKGGSQDGAPWRGVIKYPGQGNGGNEYRELTQNGYDGTVETGDTLGKVPGNKSGPTEQGIEDRINACSEGCTWDDFEPGCPRVVIVPVYRDLNPDDETGDNTLEVVGFAAVFLDRVDGNGNESRVWARYVPMTVSGETDDSVTDPDYMNLSSVRLSE
ncbi:MAG: hypothetical protein CVU89_05305 [Firmicutes bacterium HGW-Firmicutes-14]|nr:MAG: hypothetical protein CVU89_05305 [Firmicutes bacterium HGW-Firmicutes-14]